MDSIVALKQVPDPEAPKESFRIDDAAMKILNPANVDPVINGFDENAIEAALQLREAVGGKVVAISMGEEGATRALKQALAMGVDEGVLLHDAAFANADATSTAYVLAEADGQRQVTLLATGSEVSVAITAREALARDGIRAAVVSMPCWELFEKSPEDHQEAVLGTAPRVGVEAAVRFGWDRWLGPRSAFIGMKGFGASAPGEALFPRFGITPEKVAEAARSLL